MRRIHLDARSAPLDIELERTALVIVDMQNAFASKGGMLDLAGHDISGAAAAVATTRKLLEACRRAGVKVVHVRIAYRPDLSDAGGENSPNYHKELSLIQMRNKPELAGKLLIEGTWDAEIVDELKPQPGDYIVTKTRYSGFAGTTLDSYLRTEGIRYLLFAGIATNVCVESTARDAYFAEYWPILVEDAMNHAGPDFVRAATIWNFENVFGWVTDSAEILSRLRGLNAPAG